MTEDQIIEKIIAELRSQASERQDYFASPVSYWDEDDGEILIHDQIAYDGRFDVRELAKAILKETD